MVVATEYMEFINKLQSHPDSLALVWFTNIDDCEKLLNELNKWKKLKIQEWSNFMALMMAFWNFEKTDFLEWFAKSINKLVLGNPQNQQVIKSLD